ncbi:LAMI_0F10858g1_1 [Lachancea mirantina]|uniref:LAMI_0F10858g1_1 n=1 Tax=Lachancea mirantina TaxID=1230905 RepID=A0A1G4K238_9SACH|nr:LAMI_0F10858g1_1 [Lachancea mirantina]
MTKFLWIKQPDIGVATDAESHEERPVLGVTGTFAMMGDSDASAGQDLPNLKTTGKGIILNPQPTESARDPLNWPIWRRDAALLVVGWHCFVGAGQTSILAAGMSKLEEEFGRSATDISYLVGGMMLALAVGSMLAAPTAVLYGKRGVYLLGIIVFFAGSIGCAVSNSYEGLLASRIVSGLGVATVESLPSATVAEIYFAHERAYRLGIYTLLLLGGKNLVPLLSSFVFQNLDRHWLFWIVAIIVGANFLLHLVFVPETFWDRTPVPDKRSLKETAVARAVDDRVVSEMFSLSGVYDGYDEKLHDTPSNDHKSKQRRYSLRKAQTAISSLAPSHLRVGLGFYHGRHSSDKWWLIFLRPFVMFSYPAVLFAAFLYSLAVVWLIMVAQVVDSVLSESPYNFKPISVGLIYVAPFTGSVLGSLFAGKGSDFIVRAMAKRNHGIYEPEFRLLTVLPAVVATAMGLIGFGWSTHAQDPWIAPAVFLGVLGFGSSVASTSAITYVVDSYKPLAQEALVNLNVLKNVMGFAFSFFNTKLQAQHGSKTGFVIYGCVEIFVGLFAIPLYYYGKKARRWTDTKKLLEFTYDHNASPEVDSEAISEH